LFGLLSFARYFTFACVTFAIQTGLLVP
jgi:hypothetical protein